MATEAGKFSKKSYNTNDQYAKDIFINFITKKRKHKMISEEENYEHDIVTEKNGKLFYWEVEVKRNYPFTNENDFKFPSVSFLARKKRLHNIHEFKYIIICYETDYAVGCDSKDIFNDEYAENFSISSYDRKGYDEFYRVPKNKCKFFKIKNF
jgi:hypothetical protein